jgi:WD40 repeat protein
MLQLQGHTAAVRCLAYSADGRRLASGDEDGTVSLWDLPGGGREVVRLEAGAGIEALAFADASTLVTGNSTGELTAWDLESRRTRASVPDAHTEAIRCLACAGSGVILVSAGWDRHVKLWDGRTLAALGNVADDLPATALAFAPDGRLAVTNGSAVWLHDVPGRRVVDLLDGGIPLFALAWSPDGRLLTAGADDGTILLWDTPPSSPRRRAAPHSRPPRATLRGHTWTIYGLAFTPDGRTLISGGADGTVRLWDVASGSERRVLRWHRRWVTSLAVAPDGMTAAAGSEDHSVVLWDLDD